MMSNDLDELFEDDDFATLQRALANAGPGVTLALGAIELGLAHLQGELPRRAMNDAERLLSLQGVAIDRYVERWVPHALGERNEARVTVNWATFPKDRQATLSLSLLTGRGRALPLLWQTVPLEQPDGERRALEDALLVRLRELMPAGVAVTVIAARVTDDCALLELLAQQLAFGYVVCVNGNRFITDAKGERRKALEWVGPGGRARSLRGAQLVDHTPYPVATVVCLQEQGMKEPWCLVASDPAASAKTLKSDFRQRCGIDASFRDITEFIPGWGMGALRINTPARRDRLFLLSVQAVALLTALGAVSETLGYDRLFKANTVKTRTHSLLRQGLMLYQGLPNRPEKQLQPLVDAFADEIARHACLAAVFGATAN